MDQLKVTTFDPHTYLLTVSQNPTPAPVQSQPFGSIPPLLPPSATPPNMLSIRIDKFTSADAVNYPSLESFARQTFDSPHMEGTAQTIGITYNRAANLIATTTRRGAGNNLFLGPNTKLPSLPAFMAGWKQETLDFLADDEALITYSGSVPLDGGFVWMPKDDGTIDVVSLPSTAINATKYYGQFVRLI